MAGASIQAGVRHKAGVSGRVLAVLACEPQGTPACGFPQQGLAHTCPTILAAILFTGVSMLTIFSQEALWTFAVSCTIVVGNTYSFIYTGLIAIPTLQSTSGDRAAQPERQQHPQRSGAQSGHLLGRLLRRGPGRSTWGGVPTKEPPLSPPHLPLLRLTASRSAPKFRLKCLHSPHPKSAAPEPPPQPPPEVC